MIIKKFIKLLFSGSDEAEPASENDKPPTDTGNSVEAPDQLTPNDSDKVGSDVADSTPFVDPPDDGNQHPTSDTDLGNVNGSTDQEPPNAPPPGPSPGTPTIDEQGEHVVEEEVIEETDSKDPVAPEPTE